MTSEPGSDVMLRELLAEGWTLFVTEANDEGPLRIEVNCNDFFAWACADSETVTNANLPGLYRVWKADRDNGVLLWACQQRNQRPQPKLERRMRESGRWTAEFEALPPNRGGER